FLSFPLMCVNPRKSNVSGFPSPLFPALFGISPELNPARFVWVQFQPEFSQPFPKLVQKAVCVIPKLEPEYIVVRISDNHDITVRAFLTPGFHPQVEYIAQIDICKQGR